ncbi:hypothetical protein PMM47T1_08336 [Pseudomonas sp. M47T1]|nr:hypothetical protein PMM47T1_08336 [Pseudomonas sp. M47T1]
MAFSLAGQPFRLMRLDHVGIIGVASVVIIDKLAAAARLPLNIWRLPVMFFPTEGGRGEMNLDYN